MNLKIYLNKELNYIELKRYSINKNFLNEDTINTSLNVLIVENGEISISIANTKYIAKKGSIFIIRPFEKYQFLKTNQENSSCFILSINIKKLNFFEFTSCPSGLIEATQHIPNELEYERVLDYCTNFINKTYSPLKLHHLLNLFLTDLIEMYNIDLLSIYEDETINNLSKYILDNYQNDIKLADISKELNIEPLAIEKILKKHFNLSFHKFIIQYKICISKSLLTNGESISNVAQETGFYDQSHFNKYFKKNFKITPKQYHDNIIFL